MSTSNDSTPPSGAISSTPPSKGHSTSTPTPTLSSLRAWAPIYLSKTDQAINRLSTALSTPSGIDTILLLLGYSSLLTSTTLTSLSLTRLHRFALSAIQKASSLPPGTTVVIDVQDITIRTSKLLVAAKRLKALSAVISDFRIFVRLWGLLGIYQWGKSALRNPSADSVEAAIVRAQVLVNVLFQVLENGAYLASKNVLKWSTERQNRAWNWSSRFWAAHVGLEFLRLGRVWVVRKAERGTEEQRRKDGGKGDVWVRGGEEERRWREEWVKSLVVNAAWAPLTLHWSLEKGLISDFWVGAFGTVAGVVGVGRLWKRVSAESL